MKKISRVIFILLFIGVCAACSINIPWDVTGDYDGVFVVMHVIPDNADVLLNGRFIGAAYEFASPASALRLVSRENELVFKKKGFRENVVDLRSYSSRNITLKVELASLESPAVPAAPTTPPAAEEKQAYEAKTEPLPPQPAEKPTPADERFLTSVALTITPEEAAVFIDGKFWGLSTAEHKILFLRLPPGKYTFTVFKPGYTAISREIAVPKQEKFALEISLVK